MYQQMFSKSGPVTETFIAMITSEFLIACMSCHMLLEMTISTEGFITHVAREMFLTRVSQHVSL